MAALTFIHTIFTDLQSMSRLANLVYIDWGYSAISIWGISCECIACAGLDLSEHDFRAYKCRPRSGNTLSVVVANITKGIS